MLSRNMYNVLKSETQSEVPLLYIVITKLTRLPRLLRLPRLPLLPSLLWLPMVTMVSKVTNVTIATGCTLTSIKVTYFGTLHKCNVYLCNVHVTQSRAWSISYIYEIKNRHLTKIIFICEQRLVHFIHLWYISNLPDHSYARFRSITK